jgi:hypothetical protein
MLPKLDNYELPEGRCEITRRDTPEFNDRKQVLSNTIRLSCSSALYAASASEMDGLVASLLDAISDFNAQGDKDFTVYLPGGRSNSQLTLRSRGSLDGVRVVSSTPAESLKNAGYCTWLPFSFEVEATYPTANAANLFREWTETISYSSPDREDWLLCIHGPHQKQQVRERPFYEATQSGSAVGYLQYPNAAAPIWGNAWINRDERPSRSSPVARGNGYTDFKVSWNWRFRSDRPLVSNPNFQP